MRLHLAIAYLSLLAAAAPWPGASAAELTVRFRAARPGAVPKIERVLMHSVASRQPQVATVESSDCAAATCRVDVPAGEWRCEPVPARGWWAAPRSVSVGSGDQVIDVDAYPTGVVAGSFERWRREAAPKVLTILFRPADASVSQPAGDRQCEVTANRWRCEIPVGNLDVRLHVPAHASRHFWGIAAAAGATVDVGGVRFLPGASLSGRVALPRNIDRDASSIIISAAPSASQGPENKRGTALTVVTRANRNGFFQFAALAPGRYTLMARSAGLLSDRVHVDVLPDREALLREPLTLDVPRMMRLRIDPPLAPGFKRWHVSVVEANDDGRRREVVGESDTDASGTCSVSDMRTGHYVVAIGFGGNTWCERGVDLVGEDAEQVFSVEAGILDGSVKLGDSGIPARLTLYGPDGASVSLRTDGDGRFSEAIPLRRDGRWSVRVASEQMHVERLIDPVDLRWDEIGRAHVDLKLSPLGVGGRVTDEAGKNRAGAIVTVAERGGARELVQTRTSADGSFFLTGLAAGPYAIHAESFLSESESIDINVTDEPQDVTLLLKANPMIRVGVVSDAGPVVGASVWCVSTDRPQEVLYPRTTDVNGVATVLLRPDSREVDLYVAAPGFGLRTFHRRVEEPRVLVRLAQDRGNVRVRLPNFEKREDRGFLVHEGAVFGSRLFGIARGEHDSVVDVFVPELEPGEYTACFAPPLAMDSLRAGAFGSRCRRGHLGSGEELILDLSAIN